MEPSFLKFKSWLSSLNIFEYISNDVKQTWHRLKLLLFFLPCLEAVEPGVLVRRWRTESGLWSRVDSWNIWKVLMEILAKKRTEMGEWSEVRGGGGGVG